MKLIRDWAFWAFMGLSAITTLCCVVLVQQQADEATKLGRIDDHLRANDKRDSKSEVERRQLNERLDRAETIQQKSGQSVEYLRAVVEEAVARDAARTKAKEAGKR